MERPWDESTRARLAGRLTRADTATAVSPDNGEGAGSILTILTISGSTDQPSPLRSRPETKAISRAATSRPRAATGRCPGSAARALGPGAQDPSSAWTRAGLSAARSRRTPVSRSWHPRTSRHPKLARRGRRSAHRAILMSRVGDPAPQGCLLGLLAPSRRPVDHGRVVERYQRPLPPVAELRSLVRSGGCGSDTSLHRR